MNLLGRRDVRNGKEGFGGRGKEGKRLNGGGLYSLYGETPTIREKIHGDEDLDNDG